MSQAATMQPEPFEVPDGGLATFLTATKGDWADDAPEYRLVRPVADKLAEYGREGDTRIAHVAEGETVIPMEVLDADPALKEQLFKSMREQGLDPERYVVGNELNSINPVTGQPEFFLKKIFKGVKKLVKGVVKVFKKFAPIILSVGLNAIFPGMGAIAAGALGSGIGTLVQGGSLKDAFKSALIGGAMGGLASGVSGAISGNGFMAGVKGAMPAGTVTGGGVFGGGAAPTPAPIEQGIPDVVVEGAQSGVVPPSSVDSVVQAAGGIEPVAAAGRAPFSPAPQAAFRAGQPAIPSAASSVQTLTPTEILSTAPTQSTLAAKEAAQQAAAQSSLTPVEQGVPDVVLDGGQTATQAAANASLKTPGFFESIKQGNFMDAFFPSSPDLETVLKTKFGTTLENATQLQLDKAKLILEASAPGMLRQYGPMLGLGAVGLGLAGGFEAPEMDDLSGYGYGGVTGGDLLQQNPLLYGLPQPGQGYVPITGANGGDISSYPRMNGAIYGPGTETSDEVPAMLSDGEFVMTARAVRGAGNGSRSDGMRKMYDMMRTFEGRAPRGN